MRICINEPATADTVRTVRATEPAQIANDVGIISTNLRVPIALIANVMTLVSIEI